MFCIPISQCTYLKKLEIVRESIICIPKDLSHNKKQSSAFKDVVHILCIKWSHISIVSEYMSAVSDATLSMTQGLKCKQEEVEQSTKLTTSRQGIQC